MRSASQWQVFSSEVKRSGAAPQRALLGARPRVPRVYQSPRTTAVGSARATIGPHARAVALRVGRAQDPQPAATACAALPARRMRGIVATVRCAPQLLAARSGAWAGTGVTPMLSIKGTKIGTPSSCPAGPRPYSRSLSPPLSLCRLVGRREAAAQRIKSLSIVQVIVDAHRRRDL